MIMSYDGYGQRVSSQRFGRLKLNNEYTRRLVCRVYFIIILKPVLIDSQVH
jgi:hypothetical protein